MNQCKVSLERLKRKYLERKKGQRDAMRHIEENAYRIRTRTYVPKSSKRSY